MINRQNAEFWQARGAEFQLRLVDPALAKIATGLLRDDELRHVPMGRRRSAEGAYQSAAIASVIVLNEFRRTNLPGEIAAANRKQASRGGKSIRASALRDVIFGLIQKNPTASAKAVWRELKAGAGTPPIASINAEEIVWTDGKGRVQHTPVKTLKDLVSRAKGHLRRAAKEAMHSN